MIVRLTQAAEADLEGIGDWIAQDNPLRAAAFVAELRDACSTLAQLPEGYALIPRYERTGVHRRVYGNYLIFHRISDDGIEVLHVLHGARDYEAILFPGG
ncbi:MAG: type II toxin-antitoxin system RelE/ParE family toxin [Alphaproteobacteria bacterium]|nr:MAG: type II toxin-antitoxin system RelE/ParE family toxin [Alphaproteobacteria bacterium]